MLDFLWMLGPDIAATMIATMVVGVVQQQRFYECGVVLNPTKTIHDYDVLCTYHAGVIHNLHDMIKDVCQWYE